jgi:hypothetical protein
MNVEDVEHVNRDTVLDLKLKLSLSFSTEEFLSTYSCICPWPPNSSNMDKDKEETIVEIRIIFPFKYLCGSLRTLSQIIRIF